MALRPGQAKGPSVSKDNVGVGTITGSGTIGYIPYWTAAQALGDSTFRYDVVSGNIGLHTAPAIGTDLLIANASYANLGVVSNPIDRHATIFANALNGGGAFTSIGIRNYGNAYGGTINGVTLNSLALLSTAGKPSALAIIGINDTDTVKIPVYIGQKTTNFDDWIGKFDDSILWIKKTGVIGDDPLNVNWAATYKTGLLTLDNNLGNSHYNMSIAAATGNAFIVSNAYYNSGWKFSYAGISAGRPSKILFDDGTLKFSTNAAIGAVADDPITWTDNLLLETTKSTFYTALQLNTTTASTFIYSNASRQVVSLANAAGYLQNDGAGNFSFTTPAVASHALDSITAHSIGSLTTGYLPYVLTNKLVNSTISITGGVTSISGTVALSSLTASTLVYLNASNQFISLANTAGVLTNDGVGNLSWAAASTTALSLIQTVRNETGSAIVPCRVVYATNGFNSFPLIALADNTSAIKHNIVGLTLVTINDVQNGNVIISGVASGIDTSTWNVGDILYVTTAGVLSSTRPTSGEVIPFGQVMVKHASVGKILIYKRMGNYYLAAASAQNVDIRMGDSAGAQAILFVNYADTVVGSINSYGSMKLGIGTTPAWQSTQRGVLSLFNESGAATLFNMAMGPGVLKAPFIVNNAYNSGTTVWNLAAASATYGKSSKIELNDGTVKLLVSATTGAAAQIITYTTAVDTDTAGNVNVGNTLGISQIGDGTNSIICRRDPCSIAFWPSSQNSFISFRDGNGYMLMSYSLNNGAGTLYGLTCAAMGFVGNYGSANGSKMSSMVFGTYNDSNANIVPIYVGQKSTTIDNWSLRLGSDRIFTSKFTLNDNTAQTTINLLRERTDAAFTYSDDMGRITCSLKDNTVDANVFRIQFGAVPAGNGGTFKFQVNGNISGAASWNPIFYYNGTKIYLSCNGLAEIFLMQGAHSKFQADTAGNYDIQLITVAGAYVDFAGPAYVSTSITATGYLPIKIGGVARKMLVSL